MASAPSSERTAASSEHRRADAPVPWALAGLLSRALPTGGLAHLEALAKQSGDDRSLYVSTPITTGPRLLAWRRANPRLLDGDPFGNELRREVIAENIRALGPLRAKISREFGPTNVIDPTELDEPGWTQTDYHRFWVETINRLASTVVLADGWHYSTGCAFEFTAALAKGIPLLDSSLEPLNLNHARDLLGRAAEELEGAGLPGEAAKAALRAIEESTDSSPRGLETAPSLLKDDVLARVAASYNVALFASFSPGEPTLRHIFSRKPNRAPEDLPGVVSLLLHQSRERSLNVRSFRAGESKSSPFIYGLTTVNEVVEHVRSLAAEGFYTIVNETIDVHDGGVSGVRLGGIVEFAPDTTPRGVEGADVARMSITLANQLLSAVYGFSVEVPGGANERIEFSVHPEEVGYRRSHVCVWESEPVQDFEVPAEPTWPNDFSRLIGDKSFGLLMAHLSGAPVPITTVISRRVAPFSFGERTSTGEWWVRTAPRQQEPGSFTTRRGWTDPFLLLASEDPGADRIAAVLSQEGVAARYSGATLPRPEMEDLVEGVRGSGDRFMQGDQEPDPLPDQVDSAVRSVLRRLSAVLGPVRIEWAFDGSVAWVLQLHRLGSRSGATLSPGSASKWVEFDPADGLDALRDLVRSIVGEDTGVVVLGRVGVTSHVGDLLRRSNVPARFEGSKS